MDQRPTSAGTDTSAVAVAPPVVDAPRGLALFSGVRSRPWWRDALLRRLLATADLTAALLGALTLAVWQSAEAGGWAAAIAPAWILLAKLNGLYDRDQRAVRHLTADELPRIVLWALSGSAVTVVLLAVASEGPSVVGAVRAFLVAGGAAFLLRSAARWLWRWVTPPERTVILGDGPLADATRRKLELFPDMHLQLVELDGMSTVANGQGGNRFERVILAFSTVDEAQLAEFLTYCRQRRIKLSVVPPVRGMFGTAVQLSHVADLPVVEFNTWDVSRSSLLLKRAVDVGVSAALLLALSPLFVAIAIAIRLGSTGPTLFAQTRAGLGGRPFRMYKFRTMVTNAEDLLPDLVPFDTLRKPMFKLHEDPRVTGVGRFLRRTSLDELPQLFNVLVGDMSLVGPRPEQVELVERYEPAERFRLQVKPGMTGPMQVYGRGELTFEERLAVERDYIENLSLARDLQILALTLPTVFTGRGAF